MTIVSGDGPRDAHVMVVGERPGPEEAAAGVPFVGPAGRELWDRLWRVADLTRDECFVTNLVKAFRGITPPTRREVEVWGPVLRAELLRVRPQIIVTVGYHAARWFLPQFEEIDGNYFQALPFEFRYGRLTPRRAVVVPLVHSSAALRQPGRYQLPLTRGAEMVRAVLDGAAAPHAARRVAPHRVGLAAFGRPGLTIGLDSEFDPVTGRVECVTLSATGAEAVALEIGDDPKDPSGQQPVTPYLDYSLRRARRLISHAAPAEYHSLRRLGIRLEELDASVDDTMLKAYLLGLPLSLKVLAYRRLGIEMREYSDLVDPLDDARCRAVLRSAYEEAVREKAEWDASVAETKREAKKARAAHRRRAAAAARPRHRVGPQPGPDDGRDEDRRRGVQRVAVGGDRAGCDTAADGSNRGTQSRSKPGSKPESFAGLPVRALTSLRRILDADEPARTIRARWSSSAFVAGIDLPPAPTWRDVGQSERLTYAMTDAIAHRLLDADLDVDLRAQGLRQAYAIDRSVLPWLVRSEEIGIAVDEAGLRDLSRQFAADFDAACARIRQLAGREVNPLSSPQVSDVLFGQLGLRATRRTKAAGHYTTADKYLKARRGDHPIVSAVLDARQLNKYKTTYTDKLPAMLRDGRYHPDWMYCGTATGRLAERIIILIPKHDPRAKAEGRPNRAKAIRNCFHATDGHRLVSVDLSQIELRAMAHLSQDERLLRAFRTGVDIHASVAHDLLGAPKKKEDQDESAHRLPAKTINFGIINGMTEFGMLDQLHEAGQLQWTIDDVRDLLREWFVLHEGVAAYWRRQIQHAETHGYVKDLFGARRWVGGILSQDEQVRREAERQCLCPIQMTADRISKIWNKRMWDRLLLPARGRYYCEPWVRVHDDTTLEVDRAEAKAVGRAMLRLVPQVLSVETTAEAKMGTRWGELNETLEEDQS